MAAGTRPTAVPVYLGQLVQFGSITSPVLFFDVDLPDGYSRFQFWLSGATLTASAGPTVGDSLAAALYQSGAFVNDPILLNSYVNITAGGVFAPLIDITPLLTDVAHTPGFRAGSLVDIYPGALDDQALVIVNYAWGGSPGGPLFLGQDIWTTTVFGPPNPPATKMRVTPLGNGDINPPTSGETINTGNWRLYAYN